MNKCVIKIDEHKNIIFECSSNGSNFRQCEYCKTCEGKNICKYIAIDTESLTIYDVVFLCDNKKAQNEALRISSEAIDKELSDREFDFDSVINNAI